MYKEDLALNNQQWLICHKNKPNPNSNVNFMYQNKKKKTYKN